MSVCILGRIAPGRNQFAPASASSSRSVPSAAVEDAGATLHVAAVHAGGDICFLTAATTHALLTQRLAAYAREQAPLQLRLPDAARIAELAALGRHEEVVAQYFRAVGDRWDEERLVVTQVPAD